MEFVKYARAGFKLSRGGKRPGGMSYTLHHIVLVFGKLITQTLS